MGKNKFWVLMILSVLLVTMVPGCAGPAQQAAKGSVKLAMILPGPIADEDYNMTGYLAVRSVGKAYHIPVAYAEKVAVADAEAVAREYLAQGYNAIAFHGGQFLNQGLALAREFPNVTFILETSGQMADQPANVWNIGRKFYLGAYALGVLAGKSTRSGKVGVIAGTQMQDMVERINAVHDALGRSGQNVQLVYKFTGDQNDSVKAQEATQAMIRDGVDFVLGFLNGGQLGIEQAVEATRGQVLLASFYTDKSKRAPGAYTTSMLADFTRPYEHVVSEIMAGKRSGYYEMAPGRGLDLLPIKLAPAAARSAATDAYRQLVDNRLSVQIDSKKLYDQQ